jgi:hypothetical protein
MISALSRAVANRWAGAPRAIQSSGVSAKPRDSQATQTTHLIFR